MTYNKKVSFGTVAGVSLLSIVMMFAVAAPSMTQAYAGPFSGTIEKSLLGTDAECFTGITIVKPTTTSCVFLIFYTGDPAIVEDTVPAEFEVTDIENIIGTCTFESAGKKADKSATKITCDEDDFIFAFVSVETRESPATKNNDRKDAKFKPTSCGPLPLNDGAVAYAGDGAGAKILVDDGQGIGILVPIVIDTSNTIILSAIDPDDPDPACIGLPGDPPDPGPGPD